MELTVAVHPRACEAGERPRKRLSGGTYCLSLDAERAGAIKQAAQELMETLRCLKCQSQSIADSDAPMAGDMRHQVRSRIAAGEEPEAIRAWLVERYGDYVSYAPTVSETTWPLFAVPLLLIVIALLVFRKRLVRRRGPDA